MARQLVLLAPESGARLRRTGEGFDDAGSPYTFLWTPRPVAFETGGRIVPARWHLFGLEVRHNGVVDLQVQPIVDNVELAGQSFDLDVAAPPAGWGRSVVYGRFFGYGRKCTVRVTSVTLPALFHLDGAWFEGEPEFQSAY